MILDLIFFHKKNNSKKNNNNNRNRNRRLNKLACDCISYPYKKNINKTKLDLREKELQQRIATYCTWWLEIDKLKILKH